MSLHLRSATASDVGLVRTNNEDSAYAGARLIVIADGIGGAPKGELASEIVMRALVPLEKANIPADGTGEAAVAALRAAVEAANERIRAAGEANTSHDGMGTTVTAMLLTADLAALLHVGDSRAYLLRNDHLVRLTKDDTFVQSLVDEGLITADEARTHPRRSLVTQAVQGMNYQATTSVIAAHPGDRFLLCSDGLSDVVDDATIAKALSGLTEPKACAKRLVKLALAAGGPDNVTVVIADVVGRRG